MIAQTIKVGLGIMTQLGSGAAMGTIAGVVAQGYNGGKFMKTCIVVAGAGAGLVVGNATKKAYYEWVDSMVAAGEALKMVFDKDDTEVTEEEVIEETQEENIEALS